VSTENDAAESELFCKSGYVVCGTLVSVEAGRFRGISAAITHPILYVRIFFLKIYRLCEMKKFHSHFDVLNIDLNLHVRCNNPEPERSQEWDLVSPSEGHIWPSVDKKDGIKAFTLWLSQNVAVSLAIQNSSLVLHVVGGEFFNHRDGS